MSAGQGHTSEFPAYGGATLVTSTRWPLVHPSWRFAAARRGGVCPACRGDTPFAGQASPAQDAPAKLAGQTRPPCFGSRSALRDHGEGLVVAHPADLEQIDDQGADLAEDHCLRKGKRLG